MKTLVILFTLTIAIRLGFPQSSLEIDSLTNALKNKQDEKRTALITAQLGWHYYSIQNYDSSIALYQRSIELNNHLSSHNIGPIHLGIGSAYLATNQLDSSLKHFKSALRIFESSNDSVNLATTYCNLCITYKKAGLYEEGLLAGISAAAMLERSTPSFALGSSYSTIALILSKAGDHVKALRYHKLSLKIFQTLNSIDAVAKSYNNIGELFIRTHRYDSAEYYLHLAATIKQQLNDTQGFARTQNRLGKVSMLTGNLSAAENQLTESLRTQRKIQDAVGMIETLNNLGELFLITDRHALASSSLLEANSLIRQSGTPEYLKQNLELQIRLARAQNHFATGMSLLEELIVVRDSLLNEEKSKSLQAMQIRYETQKKEQEIALLEQRAETNHAKIENDRIIIISLLAGLILVAAIGILIYINFRNARASKYRFQLLLSETRHRIKNNLQTLASIFHLQTRHYTNQDMVFEAKDSESRVHTMSMLHERFYGHEVDHIIGTREYIGDLVQKLVDIYGSHTRNLKVSLDIDDIKLDVDKALALSLIIQELVCNSFKYAFDHQPYPELSIEIHEQGSDVITIVHDNGLGFKGKPNGTSQGLSLVDALVAQLDGNMSMESLHGTTFIIRFPATSLWKRPEFS